MIAYGGTHWAVVEARDQLAEEGISDRATAGSVPCPSLTTSSISSSAT